MRFQSETQNFFARQLGTDRPGRGNRQSPLDQLLPDLRGSDSAGGRNATDITFVCTANICRSAFAELALGSLLRGTEGPVISSGGLHTVPNEPFDPPMASEYTRLFGETPRHEARQLESSLIDRSGLILVMTRDQRRELVHRYPRAATKLFVLTEFTLLTKNSALTAPQSLTKFVAVTHRARAQAQDAYIDVEDPYRRSNETYRRIADQLVDETAQLADILRTAGVYTYH